MPGSMPLLHAVEALGGALAGEERLVALVDVGGEQVGGLGVGAREHAGSARPARRPRGARRSACGCAACGRDQHLAAHVAALLLRGELVLEVHAGGAGLDHRLHQLEGVEHAAEAGLGVGHDRREVVDVALALRPLRSGRRAAARC